MRKFVLVACLVFLSALCPFSGDVFGKEGDGNLQLVGAERKLAEESFITAWESYQKSLPTTVMLNRTEEPSIYLYETSLFPFKGKLKITNVLITKDLDYHYDYNLNDDEVLRGVVETEFVGNSMEDLYKNYPYSLEIWKKSNFLFYEQNTGKWMDAKAYHAFQSRSKNTVPSTQSCSQESWSDLLPLLGFFLFFPVFWWIIRRSQKGQIVKVDLSMDRQLRALEIGEKSLALQNEQTSLLRQLVGKQEDS